MTNCNRYSIRFRTGTTRHDEQIFTKPITASDFADAGRIADRYAARRENVTILAVTLFEGK